jgi:zinc transport system permease protein
MVLPVAAAGRVAWSMRSTLVLGIGIGLLSSLAGLVLAYYGDTPPGGTIVLVAAAAFAACAGVAAVRGTR